MVNAMNKKGWIRIVEATIAILIVIGFVLTYTAKRQPVENDLIPVITPILQEMADNNTMRETILSSDDGVVTTGQIHNFVKSLVPSNLNEEVKICELKDICGFEGDFPNTDVYAVERVISAAKSSDSKKVKIFLWRNS